MGRTQRVKANSGMPVEEEVGSGVPQDTVLRLCLFTMTVSGAKTIIKFADNTKSLRHVENHADLQKLQPTLEKL